MFFFLLVYVCVDQDHSRLKDHRKLVLVLKCLHFQNEELLDFGLHAISEFANERC